ncbi:uncharacterized protein LOC117611523 [Osmia lignaria lignaria]|uniref:uncharacterized protein LOC117611523 n=1 Tax=Osmia lignaria lignaria TaxID=1437193 RepID=UPI00402BEE6F
MSDYSTDSLEDTNEVSPRSPDSLLKNNVSPNLQPIKATNDLSHDVACRLKPTNSLLPRKQDTGCNETTPGIGASKDKGTVGSRNAIIASGDTYKRRRPASSKNRKVDVTDSLKRNNIDNSKQKKEVAKRVVAPRCTKGSAKAFTLKQNCCSKESSMPVKREKKFGNVSTSNTRQTMECSYLELHCRRFSGPWYTVRSPKGSTLSVWGDSHQEEITDDETRSLASPRDDQSELSFYRRLIEASNDPLASAIRSSETVHQPDLQDTDLLSSSFSFDERVKQPSDDKSKKSVGYRPYTIEEYKTLSIPKLDRSLGPDKVEMQAKREWLMRRRSYGNSVSARNCQRMLMQAQKIKLKDDIAEKCFLPPLKDQEMDAKTSDNSMSSMIFEDQGSTSKTKSEHSRKTYKISKVTLPRRSKKFERTSSFCSSLNSRDFIEDSYLESLRQRHLYEKEMVDRIINRALCSREHSKQLAA